MKNKQFSENAVNGLYHSSKVARIIFKELANMPRQAETELDKLQDNLTKGHKNVARRDIVTVFKNLADYGAGEFIPGRHGHRSRFRWEVDSINVSTIDMSFPTPPAETPPRTFATAPGVEAFAGPTVLIIHRYHLREDLVVSLQLPSDITPTEAYRLTQFIQSLPLGAVDGGVTNRLAGAK